MGSFYVGPFLTGQPKSEKTTNILLETPKKDGLENTRPAPRWSVEC